MDRTQENQTTMFEATIKYLEENSSCWAEVPAFGTALKDAQTAVKAIRSLSDKQEVPTTGVTQTKGVARDILEEKTLEIADQIAAWAATAEDLTTLAKVQVTKSSLDLAQDDDLIQVAQRVHDLAEANAKALASYGLKEQSVAELAEALVSFTTLKDAPRTAASGRSGATAAMAARIHDARSIFRNRLDKLMTQFRKTQPEFYTGYFTARVIVDRPTTHRAAAAPGAPAVPATA